MRSGRPGAESTPVFYAPTLDMWVVSRMDDVEAVFNDHETFSGRIVQDPVFPVCPPPARSCPRASTRCR